MWLSDIVHKVIHVVTVIVSFDYFLVTQNTYMYTHYFGARHVTHFKTTLNHGCWYSVWLDSVAQKSLKLKPQILGPRHFSRWQ